MVLAVTRPADPDTKLIGLEILRCLSALAVLVWHYQHFWYVGATPVQFIRSEQPLYPLFRLFYEWGVYGVQVFWMISGTIFFRKYVHAIHAGAVGAWRFFVLRFSRLYPLHLLTFALVALLQYHYHALTGQYHVYQFNDAYHALLQLFMASNWGLQSGESFNGPIWSVSLEVLAYLFFFVFALAFGPRVRWMLAIIAVCAVAYQLRLGPVFQCIFCFFLGGLVALWGASPLAKAHATPIAWTCGLYIVGAALVFRLLGAFDQKLIVHLYITTAVPLLIHLSVSRAWLGDRAARWATAAGNATYSSYLLHFPLQMTLMLAAAGSGWRIPRESALFFLAYLVVSMALGVITYRLFEMPAQNGLRRLLLRP
jgi:peptidoglycan/LPS O-acetylase OafA/YrhL